MEQTCDHAESLYGRCTACGMTWEQQAAEQSPPRWLREFERHPAQIELLQTIVLKLDELIAAVKDRALSES
ncbi:MAG TPA: hypothetical protein VFH80_10260 [Solirubrobacteraceae bacterium]|nr:hypothetical protein [Solirubrobacteraceae bacterium]